MELKRLSGKYKNSKILYYYKRYCELLLPVSIYSNKKKCFTLLDNAFEANLINQRVTYYNKMATVIKLNSEIDTLQDIYKLKKKNTYFFDLKEYSRFFFSTNKVSVLFGDITHIPEIPSVTKSRPIEGQNSNAIIFKLNKIRHFLFINDPVSFHDKKDLLISRSKVHPFQHNRIHFLEMYFNHPFCNIGKVNRNDLNSEWVVNRMTIGEQLRYKFILCLEGNDVATNLKWVMSSNSIAVMPKPKYETWFMEGTLIADYHYIEIKDDFTDVEEKLTFYLKHKDNALAIIENANNFVAQFKNKKREDAISFMVLQKYFKMTGQNDSLKY